jgi:pantoate--beta-alanine ligase
MILFKQIKALQEYLERARKNTQLVGFVPTMGALHAGHLSLMAASRKANNISVASIFVNPPQFNDPKDFEKYPIVIEKDIVLLEAAGCDVLFLPSVEEIYPSGSKKLLNYELGYLETILEGPTRPGHFQGVCNVMHRLLNIVKADNLYMGQKDYQQCIVVKKLISIIGSNTQLHACPTQREADGLAMSSRNMRLSSAELEKATAIYKMLNKIKEKFKEQPFDILEKEGTAYLLKNGFRQVDYLRIAQADDLQLVTSWNGHSSLVALTAAFLNDVRLIDNLLLC